MSDDDAKRVEVTDVDLDGDGTNDARVVAEVEEIDIDGDGVPDAVEVEEFDVSEVPEPREG